jgi:hypothetical protein
MRAGYRWIAPYRWTVQIGPWFSRKQGDFKIRRELPVVRSPRWTVEIAPWLAVKECARKKERKKERETMPSARRTQSASLKSQIRVIECATFRLFYHRLQSRLRNASGAVLELQNEPENSKMWLSSDFFWAFLVGMGEMGAREECRMSLCRRE